MQPFFVLCGSSFFILREDVKDVLNMNGKRSGLAWFVGVIRLIVAFAKGQWRDILLLVTFGVWGAAFAGYLIVRTIRTRRTKQKTDKERPCKKRSHSFEAPICNVLLLMAGLLFVWCFIEDYVKWSIGLLSLWVIYFASTTAMAHRRELVTALRRAQMKRQPSDDMEPTKPAPVIDVDNSDPIETVLMRHAAYRISQYMQTAYPDAHWEWVTPSPDREHIIAQGGEAKIRVCGVSDYNGAFVEFEPSGRMSIRLIKEIRLEDAVSQGKDTETPEPKSTDPQKEAIPEPAMKVIDVNAWYSIQGKFLKQMVGKFQSHGYKSLYIAEDGTVSVDSNDSVESKERLSFFPPKHLWPGLVQAMKDDGLFVCSAEDRLVVNL